MKEAFLQITIVLLSVFSYGQTPPEIQWSSVFGGTYDDIAYDFEITPDGGYIIAGYTKSKDTLEGYLVSYDAWIIKTDNYGLLEWEKNYGGSSSDRAYCIKTTSDGGFIFAGESCSFDGDVTGNHGNSDCWIVKLDKFGIIEWQKCFGGSSFDGAKDILQTVDGGYIVLAQSLSNDGDLTVNYGEWDIWVLKLNGFGQIEWQKNFGGDKSDLPNCIEHTSDGGFIIAGYTNSMEGDIVTNNGSRDYLVIKLTSDGTIENQRAFGGSRYDVAYSIIQTSDNGYAVAGSTASNDGNVSNNYGFSDYWILKLNEDFEIEWEKSFGGSLEEYSGNIIENPNGGYMVVGGSSSFNGDIANNHGLADIWLISIDTDGNLLWQNCYGGTNYDSGMKLQATIDRDVVIAGYTNSDDGDVSTNYGINDVWLFELSNPFSVVNNENSMFGISPNPASDKLYISGLVAIHKVNVYGINGQIVSLPIASDNSIDVSGLSSGMYVIEITSSHNKLTRKFIIE